MASDAGPPTADAIRFRTVEWDVYAFVPPPPGADAIPPPRVLTLRGRVLEAWESSGGLAVAVEPDGIGEPLVSLAPGQWQLAPVEGEPA